MLCGLFCMLHSVFTALSFIHVLVFVVLVLFQIAHNTCKYEYVYLNCHGYILRNRRWGGSVCVLQMFFFVFFSDQKNETTVLGNGWTDFHETFTKWYRGKWSLQCRAAAWRKSCRRLANVDDLRNLRYDWHNHQRRHARRLRYKIMSARMDLI